MNFRRGRQHEEPEINLIPLIDVLLDAGASPDQAPDNALVNGNVDAAAHLVARGAPLTLSTALCLERWEDAGRLAASATGMRWVPRGVGLPRAVFHQDHRARRHCQQVAVAGEKGWAQPQPFEGRDERRRSVSIAGAWRAAEREDGDAAASGALAPELSTEMYAALHQASIYGQSRNLPAPLLVALVRKELLPASHAYAYASQMVDLTARTHAQLAVALQAGDSKDRLIEMTHAAARAIDTPTERGILLT